MRTRVRSMTLVALFATPPWLMSGHVRAEGAGYPPAVPVRPAAPAAPTTVAPPAATPQTPPVNAASGGASVAPAPSAAHATAPAALPPAGAEPAGPASATPTQQADDADAPGASGPTRALTGTATPGQAYVILKSNNPRARLQIRRGQWVDVCTTPCRLSLNPSGVYRVGGGGMRPSSDFEIPARPAPPVVVDVKAGSIAKYWVGFALTLGGLGTLAGGALQYNLEPSGDTSQQRDDQRTANHVVGTVEMVGGAIAAIVGIALWVAGTTSVDVR